MTSSAATWDWVSLPTTNDGKSVGGVALDFGGGAGAPGGVELGEGGEGLLLALSKAQSEVMSLRAASTDGTLDLLEARSAHARALATSQQELSKRDAVIKALREELEGVKERALGAALAHDTEMEALKGECEHLRVKLELAQDGGGGAGPSARAAALAALEATVAELRGEVEGARGATREAEGEVVALRASLEEALRETSAARASASEHSARARAVQEQLAGLVSRDAGDSARAAAAEVELEGCRAELLKRVGQVHRMVAALKAVQEREALADAALEAQSTSLAQVQTALEATGCEADRWRSAAEIMQRQHAGALERIGELEGQVEALGAAREAEKDMVTNATRAGEAVKALSNALELVNEEKNRLEAQLGEARADSRREMLALQRLCDEKSALVVGLQADMNAAMAALTAVAEGGGGGGVGGGEGGSGGGRGPPSFSAGGGRRGVGGGFRPHPASSSSSSSSSATNQGNNTPGAIASSFLTRLKASKMEAAAHPSLGDSPGGLKSGGGGGGGGGAAAGAAGSGSGVGVEDTHNHNAALLTASQLTVESLSRQLTARTERLVSLESEVEELLEVNDRLRASLEGLREEHSALLSGGSPTLVPGLSMALELASVLGDRSKKLRGGGGGGGGFSGGGGGGGSDGGGYKRTPLPSFQDPPIPHLLAHLVACERAFHATRTLLLSAHALAAHITSQLEDLGGKGGGRGEDGEGEGGGGGGDMGVSLVTAQLARTLEGASEGGTLLATLHACSPPSEVGSLPEKVTQPAMLAHLVSQGTDALERVLADLTSRSAARLGEDCAMQ